MTLETSTLCADCGAECVHGRISAGYATIAETGVKVCYPCNAIRERADMIASGRAYLYVTEFHTAQCRKYQAQTGWKCGMPDDYRVTTWASEHMGTVTRVKHGRHNIAGHRLDVWFTVTDGAQWHGVNIGDNQVLRCKRLKTR